MKKLVVLVLFLSQIALASSEDQSSFKYGLGIFGSAEKSHAEVKTFSFTYQKPVFGNNIIQQYELGMYSDTRSDAGRRASGFGFYSLGLNVDAGYMFFQSLWGAGLITSPDSMLGGNFQFTQDLAVGVKDAQGYSIGLDYKHISSAGLELPNHGRDFITIRLTIPY